MTKTNNMYNKTINQNFLKLNSFKKVNLIFKKVVIINAVKKAKNKIINNICQNNLKLNI